MKVCANCQFLKPPSDFHRDARAKDGLCYHCKVCAKRRSIEWNEKNEDRKALAGKAWYEQNKDVTKTRAAAWGKTRQGQLWGTRHGNARRQAEAKSAAWADEGLISDFYVLAHILSRSGVRFSVDHIVPLHSKVVCGLHTHDNLQVIPLHLNQSKSNRWEAS